MYMYNWISLLRVLSRSVVSVSLQLHELLCQAPLSRGILQARITGVGCHALLQEIFPTQELIPGLPNCRQILYQLSHKGSPLLTFKIYIWSPFLDTVSCWETVTGCFKVIGKRQEMNKRWPFDNVEDLIYINRKWETNTLYLENLRIRVKSTN